MTTPIIDNMTAVATFMEPDTSSGSPSTNKTIDTEALMAVKKLGTNASLNNIAERLGVPIEEARARMEKLGRQGYVWFHTVYKNPPSSQVDISYYMLEEKGKRALE